MKNNYNINYIIYNINYNFHNINININKYNIKINNNYNIINNKNSSNKSSIIHKYTNKKINNIKI